MCIQFYLSYTFNKKHRYNYEYIIFLNYIMNILFFVRHFTERGTEVSTYNYAKYNEDVLHNKSYIICFTERKQHALCSSSFPTVRFSYEKFKNRFHIFEIDNIRDITNIINTYNISVFYTQTHGCPDMYEFNNKAIWGLCKTIKHCVFETRHPEGDFYISISDFLNNKCNTNIPVIPYIVESYSNEDNLRVELQIPHDAVVLGRYGGYEQFDIHYAKNAIIEYLQSNTNIYFIFINTQKFFEHPNIRYIDMTTDILYKTRFVNTCDAMIHARFDGETFGLAIAEFSIKNKPIITCPCGDLEHIKILGDKAIKYSSKEELIEIFKNINTIICSRKDWNAYERYTPEYVMSLFKSLIFDKI